MLQPSEESFWEQCHTFLKERCTSSKNMLRALQENALETAAHFLKRKAQIRLAFLKNWACCKETLLLLYTLLQKAYFLKERNMFRMKMQCHTLWKQMANL